MTALPSLLDDIRRCTACSKHLPHGPRPVLQAHADARILIASQAPGRKVHASGVPFSDASGERLRDWLQLPPQVFYDPAQVAIVPMGFCYPGTGRSGDLPPRRECADLWRQRLLEQFPNLALTLVIGRYALDYHLPKTKATLTESVKNWRQYWPHLVPLPHPSPRNNLWLRRNPWFEAELIPRLRRQIARVLDAGAG